MYELEFEENEWDCPIDLREYNNVCDHLIGLIHDIYETGCVLDLEYHLDEILHVFGMKLPPGEMKIMKKPTDEERSRDRFYKMCVGYTRAYAEMMNNRSLTR